MLHVSDEPTKLTYYEAERDFEVFLDELHGVVEICGQEFSGRALRQLDPIAFQEGMNNWADSEGIEIV